MGLEVLDHLADPVEEVDDAPGGDRLHVEVDGVLGGLVIDDPGDDGPELGEGLGCGVEEVGDEDLVGLEEDPPLLLEPVVLLLEGVALGLEGAGLLALGGEAVLGGVDGVIEAPGVDLLLGEPCGEGGDLLLELLGVALGGGAPAGGGPGLLEPLELCDELGAALLPLAQVLLIGGVERGLGGLEALEPALPVEDVLEADGVAQGLDGGDQALDLCRSVRRYKGPKERGGGWTCCWTATISAEQESSKCRSRAWMALSPRSLRSRRP